MSSDLNFTVAFGQAICVLCLYTMAVKLINPNFKAKHNLLTPFWRRHNTQLIFNIYFAQQILAMICLSRMFPLGTFARSSIFYISIECIPLIFGPLIFSTHTHTHTLFFFDSRTFVYVLFGHICIHFKWLFCS